MNIYTSILVLSYLIGSIPFGLILSYIGGLGDIRKIGSGNIGATNVFRKSKKLAVVTLILDSLKGFVSVMLAKNFSSDQTFVFMSALFSIIGHMFPVWLSFKGGKGVATLLGSIMFIEYKFVIYFTIFWIIVFVIFRYSSLSSIISTISIMLLVYTHYSANESITFLVMSLLVIVQHIENIVRIIKGKENKI
ncbi:glycerol-3-phosphate 1-O-acyltransferase PlsY [Ehrlichia canis]|uniref:Glycerol-3-phosphate acyltransferase n=1 Tax=Ehrlichia canis (strain Jake) TaxID=269484 RepID=PLSY_EHRCJ|nr:glycerol-3-phosphate 1-O-acyltransferase PlsY [Ehrlichia canis]Q3YT97.1 RecName: Full=Glycerol-3-phosphate acyltransferase; AltName: Full=Acyl-PO4 G3P acyltransferase; AltName: Full=Acyl-phosphate--glycerol-3-phosphate acyltransferase; AltName: Full=G3P acyltransferase; Short=GPAT; AltName: Full=Lysophosphatidic acid synthase; Short=LPA synthase [Ehrlichia canis str. Jake]AAZ68058.1 acyl-phosphate glycerol-3-phosphate acyltransferase [Ehrlichia canis str. Jake]